MRRFRITVVLGLVAGLLSVGTDALAEARTFQVNCSFDPSSPHRALDDPIVKPGGDAAHMHDFFGNVSTNRNSTYADMVAAGTRCELSSDTAAYWVPTLVKPDGTFVAPIRVQVYYRSVNNDTPVTAFPADFRLIAGSSNTANTWWSCTNSTTRTSVPRDCGKANVRATILFPNCGVTDTDGALVRDSLDHRSHAAYHTNGVCPDTHPVLLPKLTVEIRWKLRNGTDHMLSSGDPTTMHADFWNTWQQTAFEGLVESCLNQGIGCGKQVG